jgi:hypothetical protein
MTTFRNPKSRADSPEHLDVSQKSPPRHGGTSDKQHAGQDFTKAYQAKPEVSFSKSYLR